MAAPASVIVLAWNRWDLTERCLRSLEETTSPGNRDVLVVDNGSTDETPLRLKEFPWVRILALRENVGFVRGMNAGIRACPESHDVVLLNNDSKPLEPGWLERLAEAAEPQDAGIVGCRLLAAPGTLGNAGAWILPDDCWGEGFGSFERDIGQFGGIREVPILQFACVYIPRRTLSSVGLLSEEFVSYFEDADYCLRVREAGLRVLCHGDVAILHDSHGSTEADPAFRRRLFDGSRDTFRRLWGARLEARYDAELHWQSILGFPMGYATAGRTLLPALDALGTRVSYSYLYGPGSPFPVEEPRDLGDRFLNLLAARTPREPFPAVAFGLANAFRRCRGGLRVGYSMLEVDGLPPDWVDGANEMDEVWVPSTFNAATFANAGVRRPITVMPLGVDTDYFRPDGARFRNPDGLFVFLSIFEWNERKAPRLLLEAFSRAFSARDPVVLVCKVLNLEPTVDVPREVNRCLLRPGGGRIRILLNGQVPYSQLPALYRSADCYVAATHGEGWNMPLVEAMACGVPAIATDWSSHRDIVTESCGFPLATLGTSAASGSPYHRGFSWAEPDPDHLVELLRFAAGHPEAVKARGERAAGTARSEWSARRAAGRIRERLGQLASPG
ncbi:MAG: glycosyltransferase [Thermoanaerobaculia bacterium]